MRGAAASPTYYAPRGTAAVAGIALGLLVNALLASLGLALLLYSMPMLQSALRVAGAALMLWLIFDTRRSAKRHMDLPGRHHSLQRAFATGAMINLLNPKSYLVFLVINIVVVVTHSISRPSQNRNLRSRGDRAPSGDQETQPPTRAGTARKQARVQIINQANADNDAADIGRRHEQPPKSQEASRIDEANANQNNFSRARAAVISRPRDRLQMPVEATGRVGHLVSDKALLYVRGG